MNGKYALITGANTGIGYETARSLSKHGCNIIFGCRNIQAANKAIENIQIEKPDSNNVLEAIALDLQSLKSVIQFTEVVRNKCRKIDILILNAGILGLPFTKTKDGFETTFQVNYLSQFLLTLLLKPLFNIGSRVVIVSSESHRFVYYIGRYTLG